MTTPTANPTETAPHPGPTGPRTEAGKARTRINALRHGLTAREFVCPPEEAAPYAAHETAIRGHYQPAGPVEESLAHHVANGLWRLDRAVDIEEGIFALSLQTDPNTADDPALAPARAWLDQDRTLALLTTYEARIRRALANDKKELADLQTLRRQSPAPAESVCATPAPDPEIGFVPPISPDPAPDPTPESVCSTPPDAPAPTHEIGFVPPNSKSRGEAASTPRPLTPDPRSLVLVLTPKYPGWRAA